VDPAAFGSSPTPVRDALKYIDNFSASGANRAELTELFRDVAELKGEVNRNRLGRWVARHQGRIVNGLKFVRDTPVGGSERWAVKGVTVVSGDVTDGSAESVNTAIDNATEVFP
jgi:hypothetical protein